MSKKIKWHLAGKTFDNRRIYYSNSKFKQFTDNQKSLISEALPRIMYSYYPIIYTFGFDKVVGETSLVDVDETLKDKVFWVYRRNNTHWVVPAIIDFPKKKTTYLTMVFGKREGKIFIDDCFYGKRTPPLPANPKVSSKNEVYLKNCEEFWQSHALSMSIDEINIPFTLNSMSEEDAARFKKIIDK